MSRERQLIEMRENLQAQAEQVARLMDIIVRTRNDADRQQAEDRLHLVEIVLWRNHARLTRLKTQFDASSPDMHA
jgi:hypothetical protein